MNVKPERLDLENQSYTQWVKTHYFVDHNTTDGVPRLKRKDTAPPVPRAVHLPRGDRDQLLHIRKNNAQAEVLAASQNCHHANCHNQGSSAKYKQYTCRDCGYKWQEERDADKVKTVPEECRHEHTDNRGSTKTLLRTYCKDCDTYISTTDKALVKKEERGDPKFTLNADDQERVNRMYDHTDVRLPVLKAAAEMFLKEITDLEPGLYNVAESFSMWMDCIDQALVLPQSSSSGSKKQTERTAYIATRDPRPNGC